ncbi:c-type cytochrome [Vibrio sp. HN007]|uniref:c-type cytochrome n=1 Tax=Vibrio iocasae TaxID=3098914 RepID=UPI0035D40027
MMNRTNNIRVLVTALLLAISAPGVAKNATFEKVCQSCHTGGFKGWVSGAPDVNDKEAWGKYHGRHTHDEMRDIVMNGLNDHELKGGCSKCTDEDINSAIDYILQITSE